MLPSESLDLRSHYAKNKLNKNKPTYIVKPDGLSQGKGIFLSRTPDYIFDCCFGQKNGIDDGQVDQRCGYIVQQYIDQPHLIDGLKYDLRLYVLLYGVSPLRIYLH